ncbi:hypothetical protein [Streptomyces sp. NPDC005795]|uniref:hypothetical protein n=1 Tax=Streptomyces sp. NPDC005795 TaxID=3154677 RepID=UPI0033F6CA4E
MPPSPHGSTSSSPRPPRWTRQTSPATRAACSTTSPPDRATTVRSPGAASNSLPGTTAVADDPDQALIARTIDQLRQVQRAGKLDPARDPADVLALVNQIAMTWASQPELGEAAAAHAADPTTAARRGAALSVPIPCRRPSGGRGR